jgi:uncharacterized protein YndB with AHSA1/START domain
VTSSLHIELVRAIPASRRHRAIGARSARFAYALEENAQSVYACDHRSDDRNTKGHHVMSENVRVTTVIAADPETVYAAWLDSQSHAAMTGAPASSDPQVGGEYSAWDGYITGRYLELEPSRRILAAWRSSEFPEEAADSVVEVLLQEVPEGTELVVVHSDIPAGQAQTYEQGWIEYYFEPMKRHFEHPTRAPTQPPVEKPRAASKPPAKKAKPSAKPAEASANPAKPSAKPAKKAVAKRPAKKAKTAGKQPQPKREAAPKKPAKKAVKKSAKKPAKKVQRKRAVAPKKPAKKPAKKAAKKSKR